MMAGRPAAVKRSGSVATVAVFAAIVSGCAGQGGTHGTTANPPSVLPAVETTSDGAQGSSVANGDSRRPSANKIVVRVGEKVFPVDLYDNPTANDLLTRLPLTLKATDYPGYDEKVLRLSNPLSMEGAPQGDDPQYPELGYYQPGQWVAIYYGHIGYWGGKVPLGKINASVDDLRAIQNNASTTIELAQG